MVKQLTEIVKKIRVITTHEGSGLANIIDDIEKVCKGAEVDRNGLAIVGREAKDSLDKLKEWI